MEFYCKIDRLAVEFPAPFLSKSAWPLPFRRGPAALWLTLFIALSFWLAAASLDRVTRPHFGPGTVVFPGQSAQPFTWPFLKKKAPKAKFTLREDLELSVLHPTVFVFYPQDILWAVRVNGHDVNAAGLPLSVAHHEGRSIDLAPFLRPGSNQIEWDMEVFWGEASLRAGVSPWDKFSLGLTALVLIATLATVAFFCLLFRIDPLRPESLVLLAGFLLRYIYLMGTPYFVRAYDYWGHIDYLDYVAKNLSLPPPHSNWEAYQPPLYYFLVGGLTKFFLFCGMAAEQRYSLWQGFSLLCTTGVLFAELWISRILYENETKYRLYLLAVLAVAPALVFNASRVSNDVLLNLLDFLWLALLLQFWRRPRASTWLGLSLIVGLALLTKANAMALIPISLLCLAVVPRYGIRSKIFATLTLILAASTIAGWYYFPRAFSENRLDSYVVGNIGHLSYQAHIDGVFAKSLVFNPFKVLRYPFAEPWGPHHEYFLEVFFKTIFLGEWIRGASYRWLARAFTLGALLLLPAFVFGIYRSLKERTANALPLAITLVGVFAAHWNFVQIAPYISSQDFRYSVILLVPMIYFYIHGAASLPAKWAQAARFALQLAILNSAIYLLELALES